MNATEVQLTRKLLYLEEMYCANVLSTSDYQNSRQTIERQIEEIRLGNINGGNGMPPFIGPERLLGFQLAHGARNTPFLA
ncbi:MAG: hypothetical protein WA888_07545 [Burkholderiaceae bacterium]